MKKRKKPTLRILDDTMHIDKEGRIYWSARELQELLDYSQWNNFYRVIKKSMIVCEKCKYDVDYNFTKFSKTIRNRYGNKIKIIDYKLSLFACYIIFKNADSHKQIVADLKNYIVEQTIYSELNENLSI